MLYTLSSGGSGKGFHHYSALLECARRVRLDAEAKARGEHTSSDLEPVLNIGTLTHTYLEAGYNGEDIKKLRFTQNNHPACDNGDWQVAALNLVRAYKDKFGFNSLGDVLHNEYLIPKSPEEEEKLKLVYKNIPVSGKLDMVTTLNEEQCEKFKEQRGMEIEPGLYIVDHKTAARVYDVTILRYQHSLQFVHYQNLWNITNPDNKAQGLIVNVLIKTKKPDFRTFVIPPPDENDIKALLNKFEGARFIEDNMPDYANDNACFSFNRPCKWLLEGTCQRF